MKAKGPFISRAPASNWPFVHQCLLPGEGVGGTWEGPGAAGRGARRSGLGSGQGKGASHSYEGAPERAKDHAHVRGHWAGGWSPSAPAGSSELLETHGLVPVLTSPCRPSPRLSSAPRGFQTCLPASPKFPAQALALGLVWAHALPFFMLLSPCSTRLP